MQITAAVMREKGGAFALENIELQAPRDNEVLVRMVATGVCHTDTLPRDQVVPAPFPAVYGHEGVQQRQDIDPIGLDPPRSSVHLKGSGIQNADIDPIAEQEPGQPEPIVPRFKAQNQAVGPKMSKPLQPR